MVRFSGNMAEALTHLIQVFIFFNKLLSLPVQTFWLVGYRKIVWECRLKLIHRLPQNFQLCVGLFITFISL